jgi:hypothetical protein
MSADPDSRDGSLDVDENTDPGPPGVPPLQRLRDYIRAQTQSNKRFFVSPAEITKALGGDETSWRVHAARLEANGKIHQIANEAYRDGAYGGNPYRYPPNKRLRVRMALQDLREEGRTPSKEEINDRIKSNQANYESVWGKLASPTGGDIREIIRQEKHDNKLAKTDDSRYLLDPQSNPEVPRNRTLSQQVLDYFKLPGNSDREISRTELNGLFKGRTGKPVSDSTLNRLVASKLIHKGPVGSMTYRLGLVEESAVSSGPSLPHAGPAPRTSQGLFDGPPPSTDPREIFRAFSFPAPPHTVGQAPSAAHSPSDEMSADSDSREGSIDFDENTDSGPPLQRLRDYIRTQTQFNRRLYRDLADITTALGGDGNSWRTHAARLEANGEIHQIAKEGYRIGRYPENATTYPPDKRLRVRMAIQDLREEGRIPSKEEIIDRINNNQVRHELIWGKGKVAIPLDDEIRREIKKDSENGSAKTDDPQRMVSDQVLDYFGLHSGRDISAVELVENIQGRTGNRMSRRVIANLVERNLIHKVPGNRPAYYRLGPAPAGHQGGGVPDQMVGGSGSVGGGGGSAYTSGSGFEPGGRVSSGQGRPMLPPLPGTTPHALPAPAPGRHPHAGTPHRHAAHPYHVPPRAVAPPPPHAPTTAVYRPGPAGHPTPAHTRQPSIPPHPTTAPAPGYGPTPAAVPLPTHGQPAQALPTHIQGEYLRRISRRVNEQRRTTIPQLAREFRITEQDVHFYIETLRDRGHVSVNLQGHIMPG